MRETSRPQSDFEEQFQEYAREASEFSKRILSLGRSSSIESAPDSAEYNLTIAKTIFGKWTIEILTLLYAKKIMGFQELLNSVGGMSTRMLSTRLRTLEEKNIIERTVLPTKPPTVKYQLTYRGINLAKISEPVFLYLRSVEGLLDETPNPKLGQPAWP